MTLSAEQVKGLRAIATTQYEYIIGIDEVGLGSLAGPVTVAGVVIHRDWWHKKVKDSKQFSDSKKQTAHEKRTEVLFDIIYPQAKFFTVQSIQAADIDRIGIDRALDDLNRAIYTACVGNCSDALVVMDGTIEFSAHRATFAEAVAFPKADALVPAVSAASILAKVTRDEYMLQLDTVYPGYGFKVHKGYGTARHQEAIQTLGLCAEHRRSYKPVAASAYGVRYSNGKRRRA